MNLLRHALLFVAGVILAHAAHAATPDAAAAFQRLTTLVGAWKGTRPDGHEHRVDYRLSAGGSVLVETWTLGAGRESLTLYHLDGTRLLATHYCPQGNQPRLQLTAVKDDGTLSFEFLDGTNLGVKDKSHQHAFWLRLDGEHGFTRSETYVENDSTPWRMAAAEPGAAIAYTRIEK
jgi:hypothetical protein